MRNQLVVLSDEVLKEILNRAASAIVRHNPDPDSGTELFGFSNESVRRNRSWDFNADTVKP